MISPELVAAAHDVQVGVPVAVGVEKRRRDILGQAIGLECGLRAAAERPVPLLDEQGAGLPFGAADVHVVQPVAVDVARGQGRAFPRQHVWDQRLPAVVVERVLLVLEIEAEPARLIPE